MSNVLTGGRNSRRQLQHCLLSGKPRQNRKFSQLSTQINTGLEHLRAQTNKVNITVKIKWTPWIRSSYSTSLV